MPISRQTFGHLDTDSDPANRANGSSAFDNAVNIQLAPGYIEPVSGNVAVDYALPANGTSKRLGGFSDGATGTAVTLLYNSEGAHRLIRYNPSGAGSETTLLEWEGLNLAPDLVPQGGVLDGLLTYLGADGMLRCVNLARAESGYYTPARLTAEPFCLHLVKVPPMQVPLVSRELGTGQDPREALRIIQGKAYQFAVRWRYADGEQTVLSPYSAWLDVLAAPASAPETYIQVSLPTAPLGVTETDVLVREPDTDGWLVADVLRRTSGVLASSYRFYGVVNGGGVTVAEAARPFESEWPGKAAGIAHGRVLKADLTEGYPTPEPAFTVTVQNGQGPTEALANVYHLQYAVTNNTVNDYYYVLESGSYPDPDSTYKPVVFQPTAERWQVIVDNPQSFAVALGDTREGEVPGSRLIETLPDQRIAGTTGGSYSTTLHENATYRVAIQFYDAQGKPFGCSAPQTVRVPPRNNNGSGFITGRTLAVQLTASLAQQNAEIPAEAHWYQVLVARNDRTRYFLQGVAADVLGYLGHRTVINDTNGDVDEVEQVVDAIHVPHEKLLVDIGNFPATGQGYTYVPGSGDIIRFLNEGKEFPILDQRGDYLEVAWNGYPDQSVDAEGRTAPRIEIYNPVTAAAPLLYERGTRLPVVRTGQGATATRRYGQTAINIEGDCFLVALNFPIIDRTDPNTETGTYKPPYKKQYKAAEQPTVIESMVPAYRLAPVSSTVTVVHEKEQKGAYDGFGFGLVTNKKEVEVSNSTVTTVDTANRSATALLWLDMSYGGRPGAQVPSALQQVRRPTLIRFSGVKVSGTLLNGLSQWEALNQYGELPQEQGAVTRMSVADQTQTDGSIVLVNQQYGDASLSLGQGRIQTADGQQLLTITNQVIGGANALRGGYGCQHPASVVGFAGKVFFWCAQRSELLRYDRNGLTPLGTTYKARTRLAELAKRYAGGTVHGCYHPQIDRKEYWLTFDGIGDLPGTTLVYSDLYEAWADTLAYAPESGLAFENEMLTYQEGSAYRHTPEATASTFCGQYTSPTVTFTVAAPGGVAKLFKDVAIESLSLWLPTRIITDVGHESLMREGWFTQREGVYRAGFRRALNTPGFTSIAQALANGRPLIGSRQTITLTARTYATPLTACSVSWQPRSGQSMSI